MKSTFGPALLLSVSVLGSSPGCKKSEPAPAGARSAVPVAPTAPPVTTGAPPTETRPSLALPGMAGAKNAPPAPPPPAECRALVMVATPSEAPFEEGKSPPLVPPTSYTTLDIRIGPETSLAQAPGLVVRDGGRTFALQVGRADVKGKEGKIDVADTWDQLDAVDLASGARATWFEERAKSADMAKDMQDDDMGVQGMDAQSLVHVVGIVGPVVSFFHQSTGYAGGAHGYDGTGVVALAAPDGRRVTVDTYAADYAAAAATEATRVEAARKASGDEGFEASSVNAEALARSGLGLDPGNWMAGPLTETEVARRAAMPLGLYGYTRIDCCSWAENHNQLDLTIPVAMPDALAEVTGRPSPGPDRLLVAPNGCGAVGLKDGVVLARHGENGAVAKHTLAGPTPVGLIGVYWIPGSDPVDIRKLPAPIVPISE